MKNNKIKIALIDSGVDINNLNLYNKPIVSIKITENNGDFEYENSLIDENGHGTAICGIIFDKCSDIELISIKILN
ncbi:S8 family serine peptidase, partial [Clostridium botulinum]